MHYFCYTDPRCKHVYVDTPRALHSYLCFVLNECHELMNSAIQSEFALLPVKVLFAIKSENGLYFVSCWFNCRPNLDHLDAQRQCPTQWCPLKSRIHYFKQCRVSNSVWSLHYLQLIKRLLPLLVKRISGTISYLYAFYRYSYVHNPL